MPRRKRNSNKPKRPLTAYMIFSQKKRKVIKDENPTVSFGEIGKLLGEAWQKLNPDERKPYEDLAKVAKEEYQVLMAKYKEEHPGDSDDERPKKKARGKGKKKDKDAPKKPCSAFFWFSREKRSDFKAKNPDAGFGEMGKLIGAAWRQLPEDEKKPYAEKAAKDKERYAAEMANYEKNKANKSESEDESSSSESESESGSGSSSEGSSESESESS